MTQPARRFAKFALLVFLAVYGFLCLRAPEQWRLLDGVNLAIHETGHLVFAPFGEWMGFLGGTLLQLIFPAAFAARFFRRGEHFAASVCLWWLAQNCWNISVYIADARAQELPLVGGGEHDWTYLLSDAGMLESDLRIAALVRGAGVMIYLVALGLGTIAALQRAPTGGDAPEAAPLTSGPAQ